MTDNRTGLAIKSEFFILFFFSYLFVKPMVSIDGGEPQKLAWRDRSFVPTSAGRHEVKVYGKPILWFGINKTVTTVDVAEGQTVELDYTIPFIKTYLWFLPAKLTTA